MPATADTAADRELVLTRLIDAPREKLFRAWTEPALMKQWFAPLPWTTPVVEVDVRPGGANFVVMRGPDGEESPHRGVYLEVVPNERLVRLGHLHRPARRPRRDALSRSREWKMNAEVAEGPRRTPRNMRLGDPRETSASSALIFRASLE